MLTTSAMLAQASRDFCMDTGQLTYCLIS